jgi:hypothetical protein
MADKHEHTPGMNMPPKKSALTKENAQHQASPKPKEPDAKPVKGAEPKHKR